jgi:phenylpyruvate tautomerase PptA (4-oxalocrotonate tautomerase family)
MCTQKQEQTLIKNVTKAVVDAVECPPQVVEIILTEVYKADWAQGSVTHDEQQPATPGATNPPLYYGFRCFRNSKTRVVYAFRRIIGRPGKSSSILASVSLSFSLCQKDP